MHRGLVALICFLLLLDITNAQPRSLGTVFSYAGCSLAYEHQVNDDALLEIALRTELCNTFSGNAKNPGISASFTYSAILKEWLSANGNPVRLAAGPGGFIGWTDDFRQGRGTSFGLKGKVGLDCSFARNLILSISASPVLGLHMMILEDSVSMKLFRNGLMYTIMPEIGIRYRF